ncbi:hypothetical protein GE09DRAFT_452429 [Coniochaeta sp. 2T2.1]|nr:hypothetical protein GE09DRAFT_452429 [Coniochaeta sp. 2T2.1]
MSLSISVSRFRMLTCLAVPKLISSDVPEPVGEGVRCFCVQAPCADLSGSSKAYPVGCSLRPVGDECRCICVQVLYADLSGSSTHRISDRGRRVS